MAGIDKKRRNFNTTQVTGGGSVTDNQLIKTVGTSGREYEVTGITVDDNNQIFWPSGINTGQNLSITFIETGGTRFVDFGNNNNREVEGYRFFSSNDSGRQLGIFLENNSYRKIDWNPPNNDGVLEFSRMNNFSFNNGTEAGGGVGVFSELVAGTIPTVTPTQGGLRYWETDGMTVFNQNGNKMKVGDFLGIPAVTAPAAPASGARLYVDTADGNLKAIDSGGTITTLT